MAWQDTAIPILRTLIADWCEEPTYTDSRLEETLVVASNFVKHDISDTIYTINIPEIIISPDPEKDIVFMNLMTLKAACFIDISTYRTKAAINGIRATLGPANIAVTDNLKGFQYLLDHGVCQAYSEMIKAYLFGDAIIVRAILSPFASPNFEPGYNYGESYQLERYNQ